MWVRCKGEKGKRDFAMALGAALAFTTALSGTFATITLGSSNFELMVKGASAYKHEVIGSPCKIEQGRFPS